MVKVDGKPDEYEFGCCPDHLILGGGSGEHPAIVFSNLEIATAHFISDWKLEMTPSDDGAMAVVGKMISDANGTMSQWDRYLDRLVTRPYADFLHFAGWVAEDYYAFGNYCRSASLHSPFHEKKGSLEGWLAACLGELVFFSMPDLIDFSQLIGAKDIVRPVYENFHLPPPGYPQLGRRSQNGQVIWGNPKWKLTES